MACHFAYVLTAWARLRMQGGVTENPFGASVRKHPGWGAVWLKICKTSQTLVAIQLGLARLRNAAVADNQPMLDEIGSLIAEIREHIRAATRE